MIPPSKRRGSIDHEKKVMRVPADILKKIEQHISSSQKIAAIKLLRNSTHCGLREAKIAIEKKFLTPSNRRAEPDAYDILPLIIVKSITVNLGTQEEDITVDLEGLHMLTLMNMSQINIDEVRHLIDLYDMIVSWQSRGVSDD